MVTVTLKEEVFRELNKNPSISPKTICAILKIDYEKHGQTVRNYKGQFKRNLKNRQALKCLKFHNTRGWIQAPKKVDRSKALGKGWLQTKAKNKMLLFKSPLGRLEWFETGRINIRINRPATWARVLQLLAYGFTWTGLIEDAEFFDLWAKTARFKGSHLVYETGVLLPYAQVDMLKESNGVVVKIGDISHKTALEIEFVYPDWAERNEMIAKQSLNMIDVLAKQLDLNSQQIEGFTKFMAQFMKPKNGDKPDGFSGVV